MKKKKKVKTIDKSGKFLKECTVVETRAEFEEFMEITFFEDVRNIFEKYEVYTEDMDDAIWKCILYFEEYIMVYFHQDLNIRNKIRENVKYYLVKHVSQDD